MTAFLQLNQVSKRFGGLVALNGISLTAEKGEIIGIIGPNGAGKTTLFNLISGFLSLSGGTITFQGNTLNGLRPDQICHLGITRTFQTPHLFNQLTVLQNMMIGGFKNTTARHEAEKKALDILDFFKIRGKAQEKAENLTYLDCKRLEFARALATDPDLILLDETMGGLKPPEAEEMMGFIRRLRNDGLTFIIIEHIMHVIIGLSDRINVLHNARIICEGTAEHVCNDPMVVEAYLGEAFNVAG